MKRVVLFLLMLGVSLIAQSQQYRNGVLGKSTKMPDPVFSSQTEEEIAIDPLTTGKTIWVRPPERSGEDIINPLITGIKIQQKPPERGFSDAVDPNTGVTIQKKPPERGFSDAIDPNFGVKIQQKPPEGKYSDAVDPHTGVKIQAKPPERGLSDAVDPHTGVKIQAKPPERGLSDAVDPHTGVKIQAKPPERGLSDAADPHTGVTIQKKPPERGFSDAADPHTGRIIQHKPPERSGEDFINPLQLGQAGNAFGFAYTRNTFLWVNQDINTITFVHRMATPPGTGYLAFDVSKDGGQNWTSNIQVYDPTLPDAYNGRYPQGAIYNPPGNTDPDNAYFHYFAPTLDGSNTGGENNWGGYAFGVKQLSDGASPTQHNQTTVPPYYQQLPAGFTITQTGEAWVVDENALGDNAGYNYLGNLNIGHGIWNEATSDFEYTWEQIDLDCDPDDQLNDWKIAFAPDGMTGWIMVLSNRVENLPYTFYHPILFKTVDGGSTWTGPMEVQLGGEDGLEAVKQFITDEDLALYYDPEPIPPRDEIPYFMGYEGDLVVDAWGNPHIAGMVVITDPEGFYANEGWMAMFHIWSEDGGQTWQAFNLADLRRFDADFTDGAGSTCSMYNRPQVATTPDGAIIFFSWLDTENENVEDNSQPDIFFRDYLPATGEHGEVENVTAMSAAMWNAFFGCMSHYVFTEVTESQYTCTIPFVYESLTNYDPSQQVQFFYIPDFVKTYTIANVQEMEPVSGLVVKQNYPNPVRSYTNIEVYVPYESDVDLQVFNIAGSLVYSETAHIEGNRWAMFRLNPIQPSPGIYFYKVSTATESVTTKMIVTN